MYLIDTDIIIYSLKKHENVINNFKKNASIQKSISVITYGELKFGALKSTQKIANLAKVKRIGELFPIIEINSNIMDIFSEIKLTLQKSGTPLDDFDLIIAASSLYLGYTLVTNNEKHFRKIDQLNIENWSK